MEERGARGKALKTIKLFIEGGGNIRKQQSVLRAGFDAFFRTLKDAARNSFLSFQIVACGSRDEAWGAFENERRFSPEVRSFLLVDSEEVMQTDAKTHLLSHEKSWTVAAIESEALNVMATTMETWIVADVDAVKEFYNGGFLVSRMPKHTNLENVSKPDVRAHLEAATAPTQKGAYQKIKHAAVLLTKIDPGVVRRKCPHADLLFRRIEEAISTW